MHLFRNSVFTTATAAALFMNMAMMVVLIYAPVYAQGVLGVSATTSGLILIPMNVVLFLVGVVVGNLITRWGHYKEFAVAGGVLQLLGTLLMLRLDGNSANTELTLYTSVLGLGYGMAFQIYVLAVQNAVQRRDLGTATSSLQFFRNIGSTLGTAIAGTIMTTSLMNGIQARITPELAALVPEGGINPNDVLHPEALEALDPAIVTVLHEALAGAMSWVFAILPFVTFVSLAFTLGIKPLKLRDSLTTPDERGRGLLDATAMSSPDQDRHLSPEDEHARSREKIMGAHLVLLAEQVTDSNPILRDAVTEFGGGDLERGLQLLKSSGRMLLTEDPAVIDEHEAFAVELSRLGRKPKMLSVNVTERLDAVAAQVAQQPGGSPTRPRINTVDGFDSAAMRRALMMLDSALVADIANRRLGSESTESPTKRRFLGLWRR